MIPPLFDGTQIVPEGNQNYSQLNNPDINAKIQAASQQTDLDAAAKAWGDTDQAVQEQAAVVPLIWSKTNQISGSKVKGSYLHAFYGEIDLASVSVV